MLTYKKLQKEMRNKELLKAFADYANSQELYIFQAGETAWKKWERIQKDAHRVFCYYKTLKLSELVKFIRTSLMEVDMLAVKGKQKAKEQKFERSLGQTLELFAARNKQLELEKSIEQTLSLFEGGEEVIESDEVTLEPTSEMESEVRETETVSCLRKIVSKVSQVWSNRGSYSHWWRKELLS